MQHRSKRSWVNVSKEVLLLSMISGFCSKSCSWDVFCPLSCLACMVWGLQSVSTVRVQTSPNSLRNNSMRWQEGEEWLSFSNNENWLANLEFIVHFTIFTQTEEVVYSKQRRWYTAKHQTSQFQLRQALKKYFLAFSTPVKSLHQLSSAFPGSGFRRKQSSFFSEKLLFF